MGLTLSLHESSIEERAQRWIADTANVGASSRCIWNRMQGFRTSDAPPPYDIEDFGRCYRLLRLIPEWNFKLQKMSNASRQWAKLVENWSEITKLYEGAQLMECDNLIKSCIN